MDVDNGNEKLALDETLPLDQPISLVHVDNSKLKLNRNSSRIWDSIENIPVVPIAVAGPRSTGKSLLFRYLVRCLDAEVMDEHNWLDTENAEDPDGEFNWPDGGKSPEKSGIWILNRRFILADDRNNEDGEERKEIVVLLLYCQLSSKMYWNDEGSDAALMGLSLLLSSVTIFNVYKSLNEQCLTAVGNYIKHAVQGMPRSAFRRLPKRQKAPFQNAYFLIHDWNFPTEYPYGARDGKKFAMEKLKEKPNHSRASRQSRQLISKLFQNVSGSLLPFPGSRMVNPNELMGCINQMDGKFSKHFTEFVESIVKSNRMSVKKNTAGDEIVGDDLKEIISKYVGKTEDLNASQITSMSILRRFRFKVNIHPAEQKEFINVGLKKYSENWRRNERGHNYFDETMLQKIHSDARRKAQEAFKNEIEKQMQPAFEDDDDDDDDSDDDYERAAPKIDDRVKRLLEDKIGKRFEEMKEENRKKKSEYLTQCKNELAQQYWESMSAIFVDGEKRVTEEFVKRESKEIMTNLKVEYLEKIGVNIELDTLNDEQEQDVKAFMHRLSDDEVNFMNNLLGNN